MYCWKAEVGRQQKFAINSTKLDNEELNRDLMFTNKALQIVTPISKGYENHPPPNLSRMTFHSQKSWRDLD